MEFMQLIKEKTKLLEIDQSMLNRAGQRRLLGRREEAQRDLPDGACSSRSSRCSTRPTPASTSTRSRSSPTASTRCAARSARSIVVTHYQRLLDYIVPDFVHVLSDGRIVKSGGKELALELEEKGYGWIEAAEPASRCTADASDSDDPGRRTERSARSSTLRCELRALVSRPRSALSSAVAARAARAARHGSPRSASRRRATRSGASPASRRSPAPICRRRAAAVAVDEARPGELPATRTAAHAPGVRERPLRAVAVATAGAAGRASPSARWPRPSTSDPARRASCSAATSTRQPRVRRAEHRVRGGRRARRRRRTASCSSSRSTCCSCRSPAGGRRAGHDVAPAHADRRWAPTARPGRRIVRRACRASRTSRTRSPRSCVGEQRGPRSLQGAGRAAATRSTSPACTSARRAAPTSRRTRSRSAATLVRNDVDRDARRRGRRVHAERPVPRRTATQLIDNHTTIDHAMPHCAEPRDLQGHPRRQGARRLQRQDHRPPGRAEDRRQADQQGAAALRRRDDQHQAAARDLRRRREVHARRDDRPARRGRAVLPARARPRRARRRATC